MYDSIIIGGGPAGVAASIYAGRYGLKTLLVTDVLGGEIATTADISNYPGFKLIAGFEIAQKWEEHVKSVGVEIKNGHVENIDKENNSFNVIMGNEKFQSKTVILATGMKRRTLDVPGEKEFKNKGVAYCVTCDGPLFKGKTVIVVGGGNAGVEGALFLADIAKKVYLVEVSEQLPAAKALTDMLSKKENISIITGTKIKEIKGEMTVKSVVLDKEFDNQKELECDGIFIEIGSIPNPVLAKSIGVSIDGKGFIVVKADQSTNVPGLFAAGDATTNSNFFWQAITAMSEGAIAADSVNKFIKKEA